MSCRAEQRQVETTASAVPRPKTGGQQRRRPDGGVSCDGRAVDGWTSLTAVCGACFRLRNADGRLACRGGDGVRRAHRGAPLPLRPASWGSGSSRAPGTSRRRRCPARAAPWGVDARRRKRVRRAGDQKRLFRPCVFCGTAAATSARPGGAGNAVRSVGARRRKRVRGAASSWRDSPNIGAIQRRRGSFVAALNKKKCNPLWKCENGQVWTIGIINGRGLICWSLDKVLGICLVAGGGLVL